MLSNVNSDLGMPELANKIQDSVKFAISDTTVNLLV